MINCYDIKLVLDFYSPNNNLTVEDRIDIKDKIILKLDRSTKIFQMLFFIIRNIAHFELFLLPKGKSHKFFTRKYLNILTKFLIIYQKHD